MGHGSTPERPDLERFLMDPKYEEYRYRVDPWGYWMKKFTGKLKKRRRRKKR